MPSVARWFTQICVFALLLVISVAFSAVMGCSDPDSETELDADSKLAETAAKPTLKDPDLEQPDIVLITLCTFRYSHVGAYGYERPTTPYLDSLAKSGIVFDNAWSSSSWTKPSSASILTGLTPNVHRMTDYYDVAAVQRGEYPSRRMLADNIVTLAETLKSAGYATMARINNVHVTEAFNMLQGFDNASGDPRQYTEDMVRDLEGWLKQQPADQPCFAFLFSRDAHVTFDPRYEYYQRFNRVTPEIAKSRYQGYTHAVRQEVKRALAHDANQAPEELKTRYIDLYDAELAQLDAALSRLPAILDATGRTENTVIVVTADHGERFFEHGMTGHGMQLDDATVHIPLIIAGPGFEPGTRLSDLVRSIDLYPTLADLAGAEVPAVVQGRSLFTAPELDNIFQTTAFASLDEAPGRWGPDNMVRNGSYNYYRRGEASEALFDLSTDPAELNDLSANQPDVVAKLAGQLDCWLDFEDALQNQVDIGGQQDLSPEVIEQLRSLGYIDAE